MPQIGFKYHRGKPVTHGKMLITPVTRTLCLPLPGNHGGLIWNRPYAVEVQTGDGEAMTLPVTDSTRQAQIVLLAMGLIIALLIGLVSRK